MELPPDDFPHIFRHFTSNTRKFRDLTFLIKELKRLYPQRTAAEVHRALELAVEISAPSHSRILIRREARRILAEDH